MEALPKEELLESRRRIISLHADKTPVCTTEW